MNLRSLQTPVYRGTFNGNRDGKYRDSGPGIRKQEVPHTNWEGALKLSAPSSFKRSFLFPNPYSLPLKRRLLRDFLFLFHAVAAQQDRQALRKG